jgi:8-oxo-dGTP pyrophosphatase MutT (NUDIX family)
MTEAGFGRHVRACNNAVLPGGRIPLYIRDAVAGWVSAGIADALDGFPGIVRAGGRITLTQPDTLQAIARTLADTGHYRWRGETFDVRHRHDGPAVARIDRGALPSFGIQAAGVHVNGLVRRAGGLHMWVARRAADKLLDPGKLDHLVAGGISAGFTARETLIKEAAEEASIPESIAAGAVLAGGFGYAMIRPEGLRRDWLHCYDLILPEDFVPVPADGEVEAFELWPITAVFDAVRDTDAFKFNVNLVLIDLFIRQGMIAGPEAGALRTALQATLL